MQKFFLITFFFILIIFVALAVFFIYNQKSLDLLKVSDSQIISLLNKNSDAREYMQNHADFKIDKKEILTKDSIITGQNGQNFKEVYYGLELEENRYIKVDLMNLAGDRGLVAVIDFKLKQAAKAYGIMLFKANADQNGQIPSQK